MRMTLFATCVSAALLSMPARAQTKAPQPRLQATLDSLYTVETKLYQQVATARGDSAQTVAQQVRDRAIERHQYKVRALTTQYGFPTYTMVGQETSRRYGELILRYTRFPELQQQVQQLMSKEVESNNADKVGFAALTDVVELRAGRPQVYGTQIAYQSEKAELAVQEPLLEPAKINARRASLGLEPIENYLAKRRKKHKPTVMRKTR